MHEYTNTNSSGQASRQERSTAKPGAVPACQCVPPLPGLERLSNALTAESGRTLLDPTSPASAEFDLAARAMVLRVREIDPVHVERLIVTLRKWWREAPQLRRTGDDEIRAALWDRLLTTCVETFYDDSARR